jgi:DNA-binding beta-propeller fold protein YncE
VPRAAAESSVVSSATMACARRTDPLRFHRRSAVCLALATTGLAGCSLFSAPDPPTVHDSSLAPAGAVGYVVCPDAVTPVELATHTPEAAIALPVTGTPVLGNFAIATSPDSRWAYVVTSDGASPAAPGSRTTIPPATTGSTAATTGSTAATTGSTTATTGSTASPSPVAPSGVSVQNVVIPVDLVTQQAEAPIRIPGQGGTHAIVVLPGGRTILAASGSTVVPVDAVTHRVGKPLDLGPGHTIFGMALDPKSTTLYTLVAGGVFPVDTAKATAGVEIPTQLSVSSVYSPHGIVVSADGTTVYVVGQGGTDFGGRVLSIDVATGAPQATTGFDQFGISDPAAMALDPDGSRLLVADAANNWVNPVTLADFSDPSTPIRLPERTGRTSTPGTGHPTDIVFGPGRTGAFVVDGFSALLPLQPGAPTFGPAIPVCSGASSMAVASAP